MMVLCIAGIELLTSGMRRQRGWVKMFLQPPIWLRTIYIGVKHPGRDSCGGLIWMLRPTM